MKSMGDEESHESTWGMVITLDTPVNLTTFNAESCFVSWQKGGISVTINTYWRLSGSRRNGWQSMNESDRMIERNRRNKRHESYASWRRPARHQAEQGIVKGRARALEAGHGILKGISNNVPACMQEWSETARIYVQEECTRQQSRREVFGVMGRRMKDFLTIAIIHHFRNMHEFF